MKKIIALLLLCSFAHAGSMTFSFSSLGSVVIASGTTGGGGGGGGGSSSASGYFPIIAHGPGTYTTGTTTYFHIGTTEAMEQTSTTEDNIKCPVGDITFASMTIRVITNTTTGTSYFRMRKNKTNGNLVIPITAGQTGELADNTNSDTFTAGDMADYQLVNGGGGSITLYMILVNASSSTMIWLAGGQPASSSNGWATYYDTISGTLNMSAQTETDGPQLKMLCSGTLKNFAINITANTLNVSQSAHVRVNASDSALVINLSANQTGISSDTVHTVHVSTGDLVNYSYNMGNTGNTGSTSNSYMKVEFVPDNPNIMPYVAQNMGHTFSETANNYVTIQGALGWNTPESDYWVPSMFAGTLSNLQTHISAYSYTGNTVIKTRIEGVDGNNTVTVTGTGYFEDTTPHSDTVSASDHLDTVTDVDGTGSLTADYIQVLFSK